MIEAVNSVLSNSPLVRGSVDQASVARAEIQSVASSPQAPYISPYISVDINYNKAVLQIRDSDTGDVLNQFPSQSRLEAVQRAQSISEAGGVFQATQGGSAAASVHTPGSDAAAAQEAAPAPQVPEAQLASAALAAGARAGVESMSAGVTVFA